jgi:hypothetical protein
LINIWFLEVLVGFDFGSLNTVLAKLEMSFIFGNFQQPFVESHDLAFRWFGRS